MDIFFVPETWISLVTLAVMEIVLGIDNIVFISIVAGRLPAHEQDKGRKIGLVLALGLRILLLMGISWVIGLKEPLFTLASLGLGGKLAAFGLSGRDLILLIGGLFLIAKSTMEIHHKLEGEQEDPTKNKGGAKFWNVILQILVLDVVFSLDSVITAVGLVDEILIMILAVIIAMVVMFVFAKTISDFVHRHPTVKMLALSFLLLIGVMLLIEGLHGHVSKGYVYFAMAFSLFVEVLNLRMRKNAKKPVELLNEPHF